jgi:hypothetical protein
MPDMKVFLELIAKSDKFQQGMQQGERALKGFQGFAHRTGQVITALTQKFGLLGNAAAALSSGLVIKKLFSLQDYLPIDDALLRMQVNFKATGKEMDDFKKKISSLAAETGTNQGEAFQNAFKISHLFKPDEILEITKNADVAAKAMHEKDPGAVQDVGVRAMKLYNIPASKSKELFDQIAASRANMEMMEMGMQRLAVRGGSSKNVTEMFGFFSGLEHAGLSNSRSLMKVYQALDLIQSKRDILEHNGITVTGRNELEVLKDLQVYFDKYKKIMAPSKFNKVLNETFGPGAEDLFDFLFKHIKDFEAGNRDMGNAAKLAGERAAAGEKTWEEQLDKIKSSLGAIKVDLKWFYDQAQKPVNFFADHEKLTKAAGYTAAGASAVVLTALAYGNFKKIFGGLGKTGLGIAEGKAIEAATGVTPVFVVNMPAGGIIPGGTLPNTAAKTGIMASIAAWLPSLIPPILGGAAAFSFYKYPGISGVPFAGDGFNFSTKLSPEQEASVDEGARWGKEHGLHYKPEDTLAYKIHNFFGRGMTVGELFGSSATPEVKNDIKINIKIDKDNRIIAEMGTLKNTEFRVDLDRGTAFGT